MVDGISSAFKKVGLPCFGPSPSAAQLEGSKAFSKDFMVRHNIPTASYKVFTRLDEAQKYVKSFRGKMVIKASGLAAGKGVLLPDTTEEALNALNEIMSLKCFGDAGAVVIIEELLQGEEVSCLALCDGYTVIPLPAAQDHKRAFDGDQGPNTGGMGCYAPAPIFTPDLAAFVLNRVLKPTVDGMRREGIPYVGILYAGIMLTPSGPKVLEFNCRFGDPETQVIVPLLSDECDWAKIFLAGATNCLDSVDVKFKKEYACTVVGASAGYPECYEKGFEISIPSFERSQIVVFHAGTSIQDGKLVTSGGRVLSVTAVAPYLNEAIEQARNAIAKVKFNGIFYRRDIGHRALSIIEKQQPTGVTYAEAGVNIDAGNKLVEVIKPFVKATKRSGAEADIGGFGGVFDLKAAGYNDPILVAGTDGVGTKLKIAQQIGKHETIGIDLVAMSVNDVLVQGAEPLFFLDYFASSKLQVNVAADVIKGIADACKESGCALIGGETAEMPDIYQNDEYDLAGFVVGAVERNEILPRMTEIKVGDVLLGLPSTGVHSNGYSLVRHIVRTSGLTFESPSPFDIGNTLGTSLLTPTRLYVKPLLPIIRKKLIKGMVHITGGGFTDNIPRSLPESIGAEIDASSWPLLPVFKWLKKQGKISDGNNN